MTDLLPQCQGQPDTLTVDADTWADHGSHWYSPAAVARMIEEARREERDACKLAQVDAARFAYLYSDRKTTSDAMLSIELRMINGGDMPSLNDVRAAVDDCMKNPLEDPK